VSFAPTSADAAVPDEPHGVEQIIAQAVGELGPRLFERNPDLCC